MKKPLDIADGLGQLDSPEQLNDYIRVSNPSVWFALGAIVVLLATVLIWSLNAKLDTTVSMRGVAAGDSAVCYVTKQTAKRLKKGLEVFFDGESEKGSVLYVSNTALTREQAKRALGDDGASVALLGDENCLVVVDAGSVPDGVYDMTVVVDSASPLSFIVN